LKRFTPPRSLPSLPPIASSCSRSRRERRCETPPNPQPGQARAVLASLGPERVQRSSAVSSFLAPSPGISAGGSYGTASCSVGNRPGVCRVGARKGSSFGT
jgi:hypothetical protein